jgi:glycosyltransferase involved in cell wall biosynthesis
LFDINTFNEKSIINSEYILFIGTFEPRKNLDKLIKAFSMVHTYGVHKIKLVIAGSKGWGGVDPENLAQLYDCSEFVITLKEPNDEQLGNLYQNALFVAMPSLYEGFGLPLVEAMSFGKPSLTSNLSSMVEIIGDAGMVVNPNDEWSIYKGMLTLLQNRSYLRDLSTKAALRSHFFSWEHASAQIEEIFDQYSKS